MATLALIRTGDESSTVFAAVYPARRARGLSLVAGFRLYFYKNSRIHVRNKNAMDYEKTYERETILLVLISNLQQIFGNLLFLKSSLWNTLSSVLCKIHVGNKSRAKFNHTGKKGNTECSENNRHLISWRLYMPFPFYYDTRNLVIGLSFISRLYKKYTYKYDACTRHPSVHGQKSSSRIH